MDLTLDSEKLFSHSHCKTKRNDTLTFEENEREEYDPNGLSTRLSQQNMNIDGESKPDGQTGVDTGSKRAYTVGFQDYPKHGVIGSAEPMSINLFYKPMMSTTNQSEKSFRKAKFDFHAMYEKNNYKNGIISSATPLPGLGYLNRGFKTESIYNIDPALPTRFRNPDMFQGYGCEKQEHPLFRTTSSEYGKLPPTVHDVPHEYHGLKNNFVKYQPTVYNTFNSSKVQERFHSRSNDW